MTGPTGGNGLRARRPAPHLSSSVPRIEFGARLIHLGEVDRGPGLRPTLTFAPAPPSSGRPAPYAAPFHTQEDVRARCQQTAQSLASSRAGRPVTGPDLPSPPPPSHRPATLEQPPAHWSFSDGIKPGLEPYLAANSDTCISFSIMH